MQGLWHTKIDLVDPSCARKSCLPNTTICRETQSQKGVTTGLYEFTAILDRIPTTDEFDKLFEAGLDDTSPEVGRGRCVLDVTRESNSLIDAIVSVADDVKKAGFRVVGMEEEDLVPLKTIATRLSRTYESIRLIARGKRGPGGFPSPLSDHNWSLYSWAEVSQWMTDKYGSPFQNNEDARIIPAANHLLHAYELLGPEGMEKSLKLEKLKSSVMQAV